MLASYLQAQFYSLLGTPKGWDKPVSGASRCRRLVTTYAKTSPGIRPQAVHAYQTSLYTLPGRPHQGLNERINYKSQTRDPSNGKGTRANAEPTMLATQRVTEGGKTKKTPNP